MIVAPTDISIGDVVTLSTIAEGDFGRAVVKTISTNNTVNLSLTLDAGKTETEAARCLQRLADAAEQLAFAPMNEEEVLLEKSGFFLAIASRQKSLHLGTDFNAIYLDPTLTHLSIRVLSRR